MMKYYSEYYLVPVPRLDFQITKAVEIYDEIGFDSDFKAYRSSKDDIRFKYFLPAKDLIPSNKTEHTFTTSTGRPLYGVISQ